MIAESALRPTPASDLHGPTGVLASMDNCTKCGICQTYCPVSAVTTLFPGPKVVGPQSERFRTIEPILESASALCSGCGICTSVCPNDVAITDIITIAKATAVEQGRRPGIGQHLLNRPDLIGRIAGLFPPLANAFLGSGLIRGLVENLLGISARAALPRISGPVFRHWLKKHQQPHGPTIGYFTGCAVEHYEPRVGIAVVRLLNHLGYRVEAPTRACCALPMLSSGEWQPARERARRVVDALAPAAVGAESIVASSTSCSLTLRKKYAAYLDMDDPASDSVARAVVDVCAFLRDLPSDRLGERLKPLRGRAVYHGPCQLRGHQMGWPAFELLSMIEGLELETSRATCCGTAGTYGYDHAKRDIAEAVAATLMGQIRTSNPDFVICDSETCRWHITAESGVPCFHPVEILLASMDGRKSWRD
jgi:glycerol-3-phosphate dehydrogenase subunit C